jgi:pimeloyl-ACP methyl ester carboxylesterase
VESENSILHYEIHPTQEHEAWMVFVHGAGGSVKTWQKQVEFFKGKFNLLLIDLRDHGKSKNLKSASSFGFSLIGNDVIDVMDCLGIDEAHFIGVSMGSIVIRHIEILAPKRVSSVVLAGGIFKMSRKIKLLAFCARALSAILPFQILYQVFAVVLLPRNNHAASRRIFIREAHKLKDKEAKKWFGLLKKLNRTLKDLFSKKIEAPCLIVMGEQDHVFLQPAKDYVDKYHGVLLQTIDRCGHVCNIERAAEFNQQCFNFILNLEKRIV